MTNPFPGMNPYLEDYWQDVHAKVLVYALVEIDLLRGGNWTLPERSMLKPVPPGRVWHYLCVTRAPWSGEHEFYMLPVRQRLPAIRVPLRRSDPDVALDLQVLINQCYERGRYGIVLDYAKPPQPLLPDDEMAWTNQVIGRPTNPPAS